MLGFIPHVKQSTHGVWCEYLRDMPKYFRDDDEVKSVSFDFIEIVVHRYTIHQHFPPETNIVLCVLIRYAT